MTMLRDFGAGGLKPRPGLRAVRRTPGMDIVPKARVQRDRAARQSQCDHVWVYSKDGTLLVCVNDCGLSLDTKSERNRKATHPDGAK